LSQTVNSSGKSLAQICKETGVSEVLLARYLAGECDIHMTTADKLAEGLGLKLTIMSN
jgi:transcriptional regulator with XRE-family HTH domain